MHYTIKIDEYFLHKVPFWANLKIDVTENRIFWGISHVDSMSEIHSPGNFLLFRFNVTKLQARRNFCESFAVVFVTYSHTCKCLTENFR